MKRVLTVAVVLLLLLATAFNSVSARKNPIAVPYARPSGEDHPWGGEQNYLPDANESYLGTSSGPTPGVSTFESLVLWKFILPSWLEKFYSGSTVIIPINQPTEPDVITGEDEPSTSTVNSSQSGN